MPRSQRSRSRPLRLGPGERVPPAVVTETARALFLAAVRRLAPEVLEALRDGGPLVRYQLLALEWELALLDANAWGDYRRRYGPNALLAAAMVRHPERLRWRHIGAADAARGVLPDLAPLRAALEAWTDRFNLRAEWLLDTALATLHAWSVDAKAARQLRWAWRVPTWWNPLAEEERRITVPAGDGVVVAIEWDPLVEAEKDLQRRLRKLRGLLGDRTHDVEAHFRRVLTFLETRGLVKPPAKRNRSGSPVLHVAWLIMRLVKGMGYEAIAQAYTDTDPTGERVITTDAVRKAVQETAKLVGLQLRK